MRSMRGSIAKMEKIPRKIGHCYDGGLYYIYYYYGHWCVKIKELTVGKRIHQWASSRPVVAYNLITVILYIFLLLIVQKSKEKNCMQFYIDK